MDYSREQFYENRRNFQTLGADGLVDRIPGPKNPHPNRLDPEVENTILDYCLKNPSQGPLRVAVDTFMVGALKGVGKVYLQTVIDCHSRFAFGRLYTNKMPVTAVKVLNTDVLPFFEQEGVRLETILSDNGREFFGRPDQHPYELFLQLEGIEHRTTKVRRPQSTGIAERLNRTLLDEHFRIVGRKKWYETVEEMQKDLEAYFQIYNYSRPHQGRNRNGRTPYQVFKSGAIEIKIEEVNRFPDAA